MDNLEKLLKIYSIYENEIAKDAFFCKKGCSTCCTANVILTDLELQLLMKADFDKKELKRFEKRERFKPKTTTNMIADLIRNGENLPEEYIDSSWGSCIFLKDSICSVYEYRPFGCRCMVSKKDCKSTGCAEVDPYIITLNNVVLQCIEHLDCDGVTGNILDMILFSDDKPDGLFVKNRKMSVLMVPEEHREKIGGVVNSISELF